MKKIIIGLFLVCVLGITAYAAGRVEGAPAYDAAAPSSGEADGGMSYAFGMVIGDELKQTGLDFDYNAFMRGMRSILENRQSAIPMEEAIGVVQGAFYTAMVKRIEANRRAEQEFLEQNARREGVNATASGLQYEVVKQGDGPKPSSTDIVQVHYIGRLLDGTVFDSSHQRGESAEFPLYAVIPGWAEGLQLMSVGSTYKLFIPSGLAYGGQGAGNIIPPFSTLIFEVELLAILEDDGEHDYDEDDEDY